MLAWIRPSRVVNLDTPCTELKSDATDRWEATLQNARHASRTYPTALAAGARRSFRRKPRSRIRLMSALPLCMLEGQRLTADSEPLRDQFEYAPQPIQRSSSILRM